MVRIQFPPGKQRAFIDDVLLALDLGSLRSVLQHGFDLSYSTLKNYYIEARTLPQDVFVQFCRLAGLDPSHYDYVTLPDNFGTVQGGKKSRRTRH